MAAHRCYQSKLEENMIKAEQSAIPHRVEIFGVAGWVGTCAKWMNRAWTPDAGEHLCWWCWHWALLAYSCCHYHSCFCAAPCCSEELQLSSLQPRAPRSSGHPVSSNILRSGQSKTSCKYATCWEFQRCNCTNLLVASLATSYSYLSLPPQAENFSLETSQVALL